MTAYLLSEACIEAGLPDGVLNIVHGYGHKVGKAITAHPKIKAITFTGGTKTGAISLQLQHRCSKSFHLSLAVKIRT
jgi:aminomuconate-semialdehyde/2-hydroxymuconate-6-semialdehyde dehydrogenase